MWKYEQQGGKELKTYMNMDNFPAIKGYDFSKKFKSKDFFASLVHMGFQGSQLGMAIELFKEIVVKKKKEGLKVYLAFTGNMVSSGNRELITFLIKEGLVDGIVTTAAALEEDIIKCIKPFHLGKFDVPGRALLDECVGRIGNIFVPADRYLYLERFLNEFFPTIKTVLPTHQIAKMMGEHVAKNEYTKDTQDSAFLYHAAKNGIKVFCPAISDGAIGDISTFYKRKHKEFAIDVIGDNEVLSKELLNTEKVASIILGGGVAKHFLLNAAIFREGFDYSIYITTAEGFDGSDSGGNQEEAISWGKIKPDAKRVKVVCDGTIGFPLLLAGAFSEK